jgi:phosphopantothenoylcysteine decarboxylase/phosphopantothenate--cysteine ligase
MPDHAVLDGKRVVLGVTGSIAACKAVELAGLLVKAGATVPTVLTEAAQEFVRPLLFEAITRAPVYTGLFADHTYEPRHIGLAEGADLLLIAPATAQTLARMALGLADDLLASVALATEAPILVAPAMNDRMWAHPATQANAETLRERGVRFVGPEEGRLASGKVGVGRMSAPAAICDAAAAVLKEAPDAIV